MRARAEPGAGFSSLGLVDVLEPKEALGKGAHSADPEITRAAPDFGLGKLRLYNLDEGASPADPKNKKASPSLRSRANGLYPPPSRSLFVRRVVRADERAAVSG